MSRLSSIFCSPACLKFTMFLMHQALIWSWFLIWKSSSYEIVPLQSGILFQREQNIILSSHTWTVYLHFNLTEIRVGKENLEANLHKVRQTVDEYSKISSSKNKFQDLLESLENVNSRLGSDLQTIIDMIPQSKRRRKRAYPSGQTYFQKTFSPEKSLHRRTEPLKKLDSGSLEQALTLMSGKIIQSTENATKSQTADFHLNATKPKRQVSHSKTGPKKVLTEDIYLKKEPCKKMYLIKQMEDVDSASVLRQDESIKCRQIENGSLLNGRREVFNNGGQVEATSPLNQDEFKKRPKRAFTSNDQIEATSNLNQDESKRRQKRAFISGRQMEATSLLNESKKWWTSDGKIEATTNLTQDESKNLQERAFTSGDHIEPTANLNQDEAKKRQKRAFTSGGKLIKFLFGNPDEEDRKEIFSNLHKLNINHKNIMMNSKAQSLVISNTEATIAKALHLLQSLSENVTEFNRRFQERVNANDRNMSLVLDKLLHENNIEIALTSLVYFSIETQHAITEFRNAIQTSLSRILSPILIPSDVLIEILEKIRNCLEKPLELIVPGTHSTVHTYYELSKVSLGVVDEELIITVTLPISDVSGQFQMYKIVSIPWLMNKTDIFIQWEVADFFIIDESRKFHAAITSAQREQCQGKHITICPISTALYTETSPICEFSLFMGEHNPLCMKTVDKLKNNIIKSIPTAWVVSVMQPTSLTLICPNHTIYNEKVEGSFLIKNATECEILSRSFKLQRVIGNNMSIHADFKLLAIPKIHILDENEKIQIIDIGIDDKLTDKIKSVIEQNEKATSFAAMLHEVTKYYDEPLMEPMTAFAGTISIYCLAVGASILILFYKFKKHLNFSNRSAPHVTLQVKNVGQGPREMSV